MADAQTRKKHHEIRTSSTPSTPVNTLIHLAPPQLSEEEIKQMEAEASFTIQQVAVSAVLLYLSPFVIDAASKVL
ncbi:hypothetical protein CkaCkLH20_07371 [Colletotrichum karsti]|uniref:Uncharacterized protein n=1 Tax=Colletotrichum karsti TaxID=1095194 RepID=A0A9P6I3D9_9PEZI|nr:uncharacterized protein CkaCkLH20_07371 [Colletotrichum karsti]KAF9875105.1 hypothetical protein CkaCkLH20_07371 [Colletotrichum karsti]